MKHNILILNCSQPGPNEALLWNSFYDANKESFNCIFFTAMNFAGLSVRPQIVIDYGRIESAMDISALDEKVLVSLREIATYDRIWNCYDPVDSIKRAFYWYCFWREAIRLYAPFAVYIWNGYHIPEAALAEVAKELKISRYYMERGPFAKTFVCDSQGINYASSFVREYIEDNGLINDKRVKDFAQAYLKNGVSNWEQPELTTGKKEFMAKYGIAEDKLLFFFPSQVDADSNSKVFSPHFKSIYDAYHSVSLALEDINDKVFLLAKQHPKQDDANLFESVKPSSGKWINDAHIFDCIRYSDAVISVNSSAAVEAAIIGKPVLILGQSILASNYEVIKIEEREELIAGIKELIALCKKRENKIDYKYFDRLLFQYLYTASEDYKRVGVRSVEKMPVPSSDCSDQARLFSLREIEFAAEILAKYESINQKRNIIRSMENTIMDKDRTIDGILHDKDKIINDLVNTWSWKITKPLRRLGELVLSVKKHRNVNT